jgi:predicted acetyltransferase
MPLRLVWPSLEKLPSYIAALRRDWSNDDINPALVAQAELEYITENPVEYVAQLIDREALGPPITLPDDSTVPRLPNHWRWIWDGEFCGLINLRWQVGQNTLPPYCLGHIGYNVVPWKRQQGYATQALGLSLLDAKAEGLKYVEVTTDPVNIPSRRVIKANGGVLLEKFIKPIQYGGGECLRFRIQL